MEYMREEKIIIIQKENLAQTGILLSFLLNYIGQKNQEQSIFKRETRAPFLMKGAESHIEKSLYKWRIEPCSHFWNLLIYATS